MKIHRQFARLDWMGRFSIASSDFRTTKNTLPRRIFRSLFAASILIGFGFIGHFVRGVRNDSAIEEEYFAYNRH